MGNLSEQRGRLAVPYGTSAVAPSQIAALAEGRLDALDRPGAPVVQIDRAGGPLRLHHLRHPFTRPPVAQDLAHGTAQVAFMVAHLTGLCGVWNRPLRAAIELYFAAIRAQVEERAEVLARRLGRIAGLAETEHWIFSAPMPLPRAHLPLTDGHAAADIAFWDGAELICCFVGGGTPVGARRRAMEALDASGARAERWSLDTLAAPDMLLRRLGPAFSDVTADEALPRSPFRGRDIPRPA